MHEERTRPEQFSRSQFDPKLDFARLPPSRVQLWARVKPLPRLELPVGNWAFYDWTRQATPSE